MEASDRDPLALNQRCIQLNMPTIPRTATWAVMSSRNSPRRIPSATTENEAIGGYQKRLPTNRQNTYPAPDSENDIAYGGLKAYDCRNTGNPSGDPAGHRRATVRHAGPVEVQRALALLPTAEAGEAVSVASV